MKKRLPNISLCLLLIFSLSNIVATKAVFATALDEQKTSNTVYPTQNGEPGNYTPDNFFNLIQDGEIKYQLHQPAKPEEGKKYPIYFFMHGSNTHEQIERYPSLGYLGWSERLVNKINDKPADYEAYVVMPIIPQQGPAPETVMNIIQRLLQEENADVDRIYITGLSMGGFATSDFIMAYPDVAAAALMLCGASGLPPSKASEIVDIPIRLYHSDDDTSVSVEASRSFNEALLEAGGDKVEYYEVTGHGHAVWNYAYKTDMLEWLFSQNKNPLLRNEALLADFQPEEYLEKEDIYVPGVYIFSTNKGDIWSGANIILGNSAAEWPWSTADGDENGDDSIAFVPVKDESYRLHVNYTPQGTFGLRVRWIKDNTNGSYTIKDGQVVGTPPYNAELSPNDVATLVPAHFCIGMENENTYTLVTEITMDGSLPAEDLVGNIAIRGSLGGNDFEINWIKMESISTGETMFVWDPLNPPKPVSEIEPEIEPEPETQLETTPELSTEEAESPTPTVDTTQDVDNADDNSGNYMTLIITVIGLALVAVVVFVFIIKKGKSNGA